MPALSFALRRDAEASEGLSDLPESHPLVSKVLDRLDDFLFDLVVALGASDEPLSVAGLGRSAVGLSVLSDRPQDSKDGSIS